MLRALALTRLMLRGARHPPDRTPAEVGLGHVDVQFPAADGVVLRGWFVPAGGPGSREPEAPTPAVVFVHGWLWNRLGNVAGHVPFTDRDVDFLPAARSLHDAGHHVLLMDLSNHGESGGRPPVTFGLREARDVIAALEYLRSRPDVDGHRIGALGCSMGANAVIYAVPDCQPVGAVLAIQPAVVSHFNANFSRELLGPLGPLLSRSLDLLYWARRAPSPSSEDPAVPARHLGETVVRYVQGTGDQWGTMDDVRAMVAATPRALPLVEFPSAGRYEGYRYVTEHPEEVAAFFTEHL